MQPAIPNFSENLGHQVGGRFLKEILFNEPSVNFVPLLCDHLQGTKICFCLIALPPAEGLSLSCLKAASEGFLLAKKLRWVGGGGLVS